MEDAAHILVVDDDTRLRELLHKYLIDQGFRVTTGQDAADARAKLNSIEFDLLIVDIMMPGESGLAFTQSLRQVSGVPILLLTAMSESEDRIRGLECGADDYLTKPFEPRELVLRINAILRRASQEVAPVEGPVQLGAYRFDLIREELQCDGGFIKLTTAEAALLKALGNGRDRANRGADRDGMKHLPVLLGVKVSKQILQVPLTDKLVTLGVVKQGRGVIAL